MLSLVFYSKISFSIKLSFGMETSEHISTRWRNQRLVIGRVGKSALECSPAPEKSKPAERFLPRDKYETMAIERVSAFQGVDQEKVRQLLVKGSAALNPYEIQQRNATWNEITSSSNVVYGFMVTARILSYAAVAYRQHVKRQNIIPSVSDLEDILRRSKSFESTAGQLAHMKHRPNNQAWEQAAHLTDGLYRPWPGYTPFSIEHDEQGKYLSFSGQTRASAVCRIADAGTAVRETAGTCPAAEVFLPRLWQQMITDCVESPGLFQADLAILNEAVAR